MDFGDNSGMRGARGLQYKTLKQLFNIRKFTFTTI